LLKLIIGQVRKIGLEGAYAKNKLQKTFFDYHGVDKRTWLQRRKHAGVRLVKRARKTVFLLRWSSQPHNFGEEPVDRYVFFSASQKFLSNNLGNQKRIIPARLFTKTLTIIPFSANLASNRLFTFPHFSLVPHYGWCWTGGLRLQL